MGGRVLAGSVCKLLKHMVITASDFASKSQDYTSDCASGLHASRLKNDRLKSKTM